MAEVLDDVPLEEGDLTVTFNPPLYLQRQAWILDIFRRESVHSVLDIGCGEGNLLRCLVEPARTRPPPANFANDHELYVHTLHGLDPSREDINYAIGVTAPLGRDSAKDFTGHERWARRGARWMPLTVYMWEGGFEAINKVFHEANIDAFVATEVIEHLPPDLLPLFAPVLLGHYRPRLLLLTTPNFTYNQRFSPPGKKSPTGYPDPTNRTDRIFRHHDHKFEWTVEEWRSYCMESAAAFGYEVEVGGVGLAVEPDPWNREDNLGFASQVAVFRRKNAPVTDGRDLAGVNPHHKPVLQAVHTHEPHPLSSEELSFPSDREKVHQAVREAMNEREESTLTFAELWSHGVVSMRCKGQIGELERHFKSDGLDPDEWVVIKAENGWETAVTWKRHGRDTWPFKPSWWLILSLQFTEKEG
ncbi:hypothetical protein BU17DRAFT_41023 [Hysterangium stoloniferum]|nr:hypothetical protein BU17DRAFT_41023 [Hysterangium stoloniferum]